MIYSAFSGASVKNMEVHHLNFNKHDNAFENLELLTKVEFRRKVDVYKVSEIPEGDEIAEIEEYPDYKFYRSGSIRSKLTGQVLGSIGVSDKCYKFCDVSPKDGGRQHRYKVHHLIYWAFSGSKPNITKDVEVHHINLNLHDNAFSNLALMTFSEHKQKMQESVEENNMSNNEQDNGNEQVNGPINDNEKVNGPINGNEQVNGPINGNEQVNEQVNGPINGGNAIAYITEYPNYMFHRSGKITSISTGKALGRSPKNNEYIKCEMVNKDGARHQKCHIHLMIYWAFSGSNPNTKNGLDIHHINFNKHDNAYSNLEMLTKEQKKRKLDSMKPIDCDEVANIDEYPNYNFHKSGFITSKQTGKELGSKLTSQHYSRCELMRNDGETQRCRLHRMIYWAFSGINPGDMEVDHINQNKDDNSFANLQLLSKAEHTRKTNRDNPCIGAKGSLKTLKRLIRIDSFGNERQFDSVTAAFKDLGKELSGKISKACHDGSTYSGFKWKWNIPEEHLTCEWRKINVIGCDQEVYANDNGYIKTTHVITKGNLNTDGNYTFVVQIYGKRVEKGVHQLVCSAFHGLKPEWANCVSHTDCDRTNNKPDNLQWSNQSSGSNVILLKLADNTEHEFNSLKSASEYLQLAKTHGYQIKQAFKNETEIFGHKVIGLDAKNKKI
jgi:hypothetical protein